MCGRAAQGEFSEIEKRFHLKPGGPPAGFRAHWNAAPRMDLLTIRYDAAVGGRVAGLTRWGLVPGWATDAKVGDRAVNARAEGVEEKPTFRSAWRASRRCIIPLVAFYEWKRAAGGKQPFAFGMPDETVFGVAGLWETWRDIVSFTIITTTANGTVGQVHDRMPVIVGADDYDAWLHGSAARAKPLLVPWAGDLKVWAVSRLLNKSGEMDGPECLSPCPADAPINLTR